MAFAVAIMFMIGFAVIGLEYAVTLGIIAGFKPDPLLRIIFSDDSGYLLAIVAGPFMIIKVLIVFAVEQTIEGRLISISTRESVSNPSSNDFISSADFWEIVRNHRCDLGDSCLCSN